MLSVSVVIPSYNSARFLGEALHSVRRQLRHPHEVIVVDDCSADDSLIVARRAGAQCLLTPSNSGPSGARNAGIRAARGDVVAFLDSDDVWEQDHLSTLIPLLERHPDAALAYSRVRSFGLQTWESPLSLTEDVASSAFWMLLRRNFVSQTAVVVRREALQSVGGYDETMRYSEDYDLWLRMAWRHSFVCSRAVTALYRTHAEQGTANAAPRMVRGWWTAREHALSVVRREGSPHDVRRVSEELRNAWRHDLRWAWSMCSREVFELVLAQAPKVPESAAMQKRWRRAMLAWPVWQVLFDAWWSLPRYVRHGLRKLLRRTADS